MQLSSDQKKVVRRISLTPLADLVFILLVFFILETSFNDVRQLEYDVPAQNSTGNSTVDVLRLELYADGLIWIAGQAIKQVELAEFLRNGSVIDGAAVLISVHDTTTLQLLINTIDQLRQRDLGKIQIVSLNEKSRPPK